MKIIDVTSIDMLARGCALLGTGGGGETRTAATAARHVLGQHGPVKLITPGQLDRDQLIMPLSGVGAPTVSSEMMPGLGEATRLRAAVEEATGRRVAAVMASEIGGANGVMAAAWAAQLGLPLVDGDGMGRAFPEVPMVSMHVTGLVMRPLMITDVHGNISEIHAVNPASAERIARSVCVAGGCHVLMADYLMSAEEAEWAIIGGSVSKALALGKLLTVSPDPVTRALEMVRGSRLMVGKVVDVERRIAGGFTRGHVSIVGSGGMFEARAMRIDIQNEFLVARENGNIVASVPDSIALVHTETGEAVATEAVRYGQRVSVLAWPCEQIWRTTRGLEVAGPSAFGYDFEYTPIEELSPDALGPSHLLPAGRRTP